MSRRACAISLLRNALYLEQYEQAFIDLDQAIALDPYYIKAYLNRGNVYRHMQQYKQAITDYTQALILDPYCVKAHLCRAYVYLFLKMIEQAQADFVRYATLNPNDVNAAWMVLYSSLGKQRPRGEFAKRLESIAVLDPQSHEACICRGVALGLRGKLQEGLTELEHALQLRSKSEDALFWKGMIYAYIGYSLEAVEFIGQAIQTGLPPVLLTPLYWLEQDKPQFYHGYAKPLLKRYEIDR